MVVRKKEDDRMRVGIDCRMWSQSGVGRYIRNLVFNLQKLDKRNDYFIFFLRKDFNSFSFNRNFIKVQANFGWYGLVEQLKFPKLLNQYSLDLVHVPHFNVPFFYSGKYIVTIHDLIHQHFKMERVTTLYPLIYRAKQFGYNKVFKNALDKSQKILVPSNFVKGQLMDEWSVDQKRIVVTHEAVEGQLIAIATGCTQIKINKVLQKFNIKQPFLFYVGNAHPHKNVEGLIAAFLQLKLKFDSLKLVLSGHDHYFWQRVKKDYQHKDIIYTGYITDEQLVALYKGAKVFVMPSFEEGFGIPILEAMALSCPVVSSNAGALKEVGADAALYFDPNNQEDMVEKISLLCHPEGSDGSNNLREQLIEKGKKRYKEFSWEKLAKQTLKVYNAPN